MQRGYTVVPRNPSYGMHVAWVCKRYRQCRTCFNALGPRSMSSGAVAKSGKAELLACQEKSFLVFVRVCGGLPLFLARGELAITVRSEHRDHVKISPAISPSSFLQG